jgi:hypothetical protein
MNHVLRSPDISETPVVIPIRSGRASDVDDENEFQSFDPAEAEDGSSDSDSPGTDEQSGGPIEDEEANADPSVPVAGEQEGEAIAGDETESGPANTEQDATGDEESDGAPPR